MICPQTSTLVRLVKSPPAIALVTGDTGVRWLVESWALAAVDRTTLVEACVKLSDSSLTEEYSQIPDKLNAHERKSDEKFLLRLLTLPRDEVPGMILSDVGGLT
ncbi:hypothetical protein PILCRDRAFT_91955 [Piloderma croceum F 1598]|uniref:Uncharacterized protein n=1 Tax=Piloderma croceum (strain F 1598) TaxID=765440 RepID=A0A0C3ET57_PILCF|nr:hypothetical protein PILCRDRAFT_91955 [Piloderma croceum F 1598]